MGDFRRWFENEEQPKVAEIQFSDIVMSRNSLFAAMNNIGRGGWSRTKGEVEVLHIEAENKYQLIDGYHRAFEMLLQGNDSVHAIIHFGYSDYFAIAKGTDRFKYIPSAEFRGLENLAGQGILRRLRKKVPSS